MSYTFPQMMSEFDPNFQFTQIEVDTCWHTHYGIFVIHSHLQEVYHIHEREKIKIDIKTKLLIQVREDVIKNRQRLAQSYANDLISRLTFPAPDYIAVYPV